MLAKAAELVDYNPETGGFKKKSDGRVLATKHPKGYLRVKIGAIDVLSHRLAWFMSHGEEPACIDHINHIKSDNRLVNLRAASVSQNLCNRSGLQSNNTSGHVGVAMNHRKTKWVAYIKLAGRRKHLGVFDCFDDAVKARLAAEPVYMGEFAPRR